MKCWICGAEMKNTIGGCYQCENCYMAAIDDGILRYPQNMKSYKNYNNRIKPNTITISGNNISTISKKDIAIGCTKGAG